MEILNSLGFLKFAFSKLSEQLPFQLSEQNRQKLCLHFFNKTVAIILLVMTI